MKSVATHPRRGFTLVELLMVITIIGMLMALLVAGVMRALVTAKIARITVEAGMLDTGVQNYKNEIGGDYPPDCSFLGTTQQWVDVRNNRILAHLRKAFPRFYVSGYGNTSGPVSAQGTLQYAVQQAFKDYDAASPPLPYPATTPNGASVWGDLNNLDQAESLVFWLGGLPAPPVLNTTSNTYSFRLAGFSANKLQPFNLIDGSRLKGPFEFQEQRFGDADGDGWLEYYPPVDLPPQPTGSSAAQPGNATAPYVYFNAGSYADVTPSNGFPAYPSSGQYPAVTGGSMPVFPSNSYASLWGAAIPYANAYNISTTPAQLTWFNPEKFQIVSASLDSMYWSLTTGASSGPDDFRVFPSGTHYSQADLDNVTNFSNGKLQDSLP